MSKKLRSVSVFERKSDDVMQAYDRLFDALRQFGTQTGHEAVQDLADQYAVFSAVLFSGMLAAASAIDQERKAEGRQVLNALLARTTDMHFTLKTLQRFLGNELEALDSPEGSAPRA